MNFLRPPSRPQVDENKMKIRNLLGWSSALCLSASMLQAQDASETEKLNKQLKQLQESFEKQQAEMKANFERLVREQQAQIDALKKQIVTATNAAPGTPPPKEAARSAEQLNELNDKVDRVIEAQK